MSYSPNYKGRRQPEKTILEVIVVGIFKGLWWLIKLPFGGKGKKKGLLQHDLGFIRAKRQEIEGFLNSTSEVELKHAVMESDKLADYVLKALNYSGETFADRLRSAENHINQDVYQSLWHGHKIRNQIAHETELKISNPELKHAAEQLLKYTRQF